MFSIQRLRLEITTTDFQDSGKTYGFDIPFNKGLNIIAGENSKGKSTISSAIYYSMGMEELLGGQNDKALDKALKTEFDTFDSEGKIDTKYILLSIVYLEIINSNGRIATLKRIIKTGESGHGSSDKETKSILVYESTYDNISDRIKTYPLFLRNHNNHEDEFGFYHWLADFIGIKLPRVPSFSKNEGESVLYLQTIFPAFLIEQTKGWSDFLATCPYFGIAKNKEKSVAYILNLNELAVSAERDRIKKEENELKQKWADIYYKVQILAAEYNAHPNLVPSEISIDKSSLDKASLMIHGEEPGSIVNVKALRDSYAKTAEELNLRPIKSVGENKKAVQLGVETLYKEQSIFMKRFQRFDLQFNLDKSQLHNLKKHLINIEKEISSLQGIKNIIDQSIIVSDVFDKCPKCNQTVSADLLANEGVSIEKLTVDENLTYLKGQRKIIEGAIKSLTLTLEEKAIMRKYYIRKQREFEVKIKLTLQELIADDRGYSETETLKRVRLENMISDLTLLSDIFGDFIEQMGDLIDLYEELARQKANLEDSFEHDKKILLGFETIFKTEYLSSFQYTSNSLRNIYIQLAEPFKYFPVFKHSEEDKFPQPIKNNSSASDFVRTLWSYSLALLVAGSNHPGILLIDEPGQHSVRSSSLKVLFEKASQLRTKQVIIFTSVQKLLSNEEKNQDKLDLDKLLSDLVINDDYSLYRIDPRVKSITRIN